MKCPGIKLNEIDDQLKIDWERCGFHQRKHGLNQETVGNKLDSSRKNKENDDELESNLGKSDKDLYFKCGKIKFTEPGKKGNMAM